MFLDQPTIYILGLRIDDPMNCATDLLVTAICWYAFIAMRRSGARDSSTRLMMSYFIVMGAATLFGGILGHAFKYALSPLWKLLGWVTSMFSVMFIERASIEYARPYMGKRIGEVFLVLNVIELVTVMFLACYYLEFNWVLAHQVYGLGFIVGGFHLYVWIRTRDIGSKRMVQAILIAGVGAVFYINEWGVSPWFNHLDVGHTTMALAAWFFYLGARKMSASDEDNPDVREIGKAIYT